MGMDLTGIINQNEYYTNHYFSSIFEENAKDTITKWRSDAKEAEDTTPWAKFRKTGTQYFRVRDRYAHMRNEVYSRPLIQEMAKLYLEALGFGQPNTVDVPVGDDLQIPVFHEVTKSNGAPLLWVLMSQAEERDDDILDGHIFSITDEDDEDMSGKTVDLTNEDAIPKMFFAGDEAPRWLIFIGIGQIALIDRNKWNDKRFLQFDLDKIFSRREETTFQALSVLLSKESLCPDEGQPILDALDENSHKHSAEVSDALKYALRECIELLGNEVIYYMKNDQQRDFETDPVDAGELTIECLRYMYRVLFMLFIEAREELGYAPMKAESYVRGYSLEGLRDICDQIRGQVSEEVDDGYYLDDTLKELFRLVYNGYPENVDEYKKYANAETQHDMFTVESLKAHIFDPEYTKLITESRLRNKVMLQIIDLMSISRPGSSKQRRGRISYSALGINQMGAVYEALLSYRGFFAEETLFEVKRAGDHFNPLDVGYFVPERELDNYTEEERVREDDKNPASPLRKYEKGTFIYRLAGREREKSASYYTPEVLTQCLVKYALKELLKDKTADEILNLTICEPAMGSAAFLNEAISQMAEAYLTKKQEELGETIDYDKRKEELQKVKMYIADRNVYGVDLNPVAVELAEVSLWLNTIYKGAFVPWFGTQLVCGNSLIGARRQTYTASKLQAGKWYDDAPVRIEPTEDRSKGSARIYHFLVGDPGMANYSDKVIKSLEPDNIKLINNWRKEFNKPWDDEDIKMLKKLSDIIDGLWKETAELRSKIEKRTEDSLSVYGHDEEAVENHLTIREKDKIYQEIFKSENMKNAGPYARLRAAMDYWCSLWFWPIDKADILPTRQEFLFEMDLILEGGIQTVKQSAEIGQMQFGVDANGNFQLFTEGTQMELELSSEFSNLGTVDLAQLREKRERLAVSHEIAKQQHFLHWELEFADLFRENGGFDLVIGNPPWVLLGWNEHGVLADYNPMFAIKKLSATDTSKHRDGALNSLEVYKSYFCEYESIVGEQSFLNAVQNYPDLTGMKANLYKCFIPHSWELASSKGVTAFIHPDGVYDDPKGGQLREKLYPKLKAHFQFENEFNLFEGTNDHGRMRFSLNVYSNKSSYDFVAISNLFTTSTIEECFEKTINGNIPGIKDSNGKWNTNGHPGRVVHVQEKELKLFASLFDGDNNWKQARLPMLHAEPLVEVLERMAEQPKTLGNLGNKMYSTQMWNETQAQSAGIIERNIHFPEEIYDGIYSGAHMGVLNPFYKSMRRVYNSNNDYDSVDLEYIEDDYFQRCMYTIALNLEEYLAAVPVTSYNVPYTSQYRLFVRKMLNQNGERTLIGAIMPPKTGHTNGILGFSFEDEKKLIISAGLLGSLPYDFYIKSMGRSNFYEETAKQMPLLEGELIDLISNRVMLLNCVSNYYSELWRRYKGKQNDSWTKEDSRLKNANYTSLLSEWERLSPLRTDYERRQALVEIDVLVAMSLGMTLEQLITIYQIQFPVLNQYEMDTWYDANGRIVFTSNRSLTGVGFDRKEWESGIKDATDGSKFYRTIMDDTVVGGPIERTIEYVAPFDKCNREQDYKIAWKFFEEKYGDKK